MANLTVAQVKSFSKPGLYGDGGTLYLRVASGGSKAWIQRLTIEGKRRDIGLGGFPLVTLAEARRKSLDNRRLAREGGDPLAEKRRQKMPTFREAAQRTHEGLRPRWRNGKHTVSWMQTLERHAFPVLADMPVDRIGREDVLNVLIPIWGDRMETARRIRQRIRTVLGWCEAHGFVDNNVAGDSIKGALPPMPPVKAHYRALPHHEVADALRMIAHSGASISAKCCLRFVILTATRSGAARGATWREIDLSARIWTIPAHRMKNNVEHRVPLNDAALEAVGEVRELKDASGLIFPSPQLAGRPLSDMTLTKVLRNLGLAERATVHGFRNSFRDWAAESGKRRELAEAALAHEVGGVEGAYFRSKLLEGRRELMEEWGRYVTGRKTDVVVKMHA